MPIAIWSDAYVTGHPVVDRQHQHLFSLVNDLHHGIVSGHGRDKMGPILKELARYTVEHFATEEGFMREKGYPNLVRHKAKHDDLKGQVVDLIGKFDSGELSLPSTLSKFLADWVSHHIKEEDKELVAWLKAKG